MVKNIITPPNPLFSNLMEEPTIFLAGTIDMGNSIDWQAQVIDRLIKESSLTVNICNPRRSDWDSSWKTRITDEKFYNQVNWELNGLEKSDTVFFHFASNSLSPISLLELGLCAREGNVIVTCSEKYSRLGNIEIVCERFNIPIFNTLDEGVNEIIKTYKGFGMNSKQIL